MTNLNLSKMLLHSPRPVGSIENLRSRVNRLFRPPAKRSKGRFQVPLDLPLMHSSESLIEYPSKSIANFLDFITDTLPDGDVYLFGGVLRDLALLGRKGFNSDIDVVVEGDWRNCVSYLETLGARKNKFGGYRLEVDGWPIDIWNAKETWAIKQGLVQYKSIASLTETTVLNWDAILMNWRTRTFIYPPNYFEAIKTRVLDIVLEKNPDPLGMAVRVFRHLCSKDAKKITTSATEYLVNCTKSYSFDDIINRELRSYGNTLIDSSAYKFFDRLRANENLDMKSRFGIARDILKKERDLTKLFL
jgi:predicted nucleotidyltransferase